MKLTRHVHQQIRLKNWLSTLVLLSALGGVAWLSTRYSYQVDWTQTGSNTLSPATQNLLQQMPGKISIYASYSTTLCGDGASILWEHDRHHSPTNIVMQAL